MKRNAHTPLYFSAYPLKAITEPASNGSSSAHTPYLRSVLAGKTKTSSRVRVFPMANPYTQKKVNAKPIKPAKNVESSGADWFNHYE